MTTTYYELAFSVAAGSVFDQFQSDVDRELAASATQALSRMPTVAERLAANDAEAISHAMTTCRRIIDSFADAIFAPRDEPLVVDGREIALSPLHHLNRLNAYIRERSASTSRRDRLRRTLSDLYSRVTAGIHADVTSDEARALFLQTYVTLGEIALLPSIAT